MDWSLFDRYREIIPDYEAFLQALELPFPIGLRGEVSPHLKAQHKATKVFEDLPFYEVEGERKFWGGQLDHHHGAYFMQAFSSLLSSLSLAPRPGDCVLDMCAAPGGKTTHLASLMKNSGLLIACEPDLNRRRILKANLNRMLVANCAVFAGKAQDLQFKKESFDKILLDGPCSSEGTFRTDTISGKKRRKVNYLTYNKAFRVKLHQEQALLLDHAYGLLKKGGTLVYSTCTFDPDENEKAVDQFLKRYSDMEIDELGLDSSIDEKLSPGIVRFGNEEFDPLLCLTRRVYPHQLNSIGFYVAKLRKR